MPVEDIGRKLSRASGGVVVVHTTPDGVWHKDSHYRGQLIGGVYKLQTFIREKLEEIVFVVSRMFRVFYCFYYWCEKFFVCFWTSFIDMLLEVLSLSVT